MDDYNDMFYTAPDPESPVEPEAPEAPQTPAEPPRYQPYTPPQAQQPSGEQPGKSRNTAAMVCGIVGLALCFLFIFWPIGLILSIVAVVLGVVSYVKNQGDGKTLAGVICGGIGTLLGFLCLVVSIFIGSVFSMVFTEIMDDPELWMDYSYSYDYDGGNADSQDFFFDQF